LARGTQLDDQLDGDEYEDMQSVRWMAPEILLGGFDASAADIFSYAMCLIELTNRNLPWHGTEYRRIPLLVTRGRRPAQLAMDSSGGEQLNFLNSLIKRCWEQNPTRRPSAGVIAQQVQEEYLNVKTSFQATVDMVKAAQGGRTEEVARLLRDFNADPNGVDERVGGTALSWAACGNHVSTMEVLVHAGADLNKPNKGEIFRGRTPLMWGAVYHSGSVQWLLEHGADWRKTDKSGRTALDLALRDAQEDRREVRDFGTERKAETAAVLRAWATKPTSCRICIKNLTLYPLELYWICKNDTEAEILAATNWQSRSKINPGTVHREIAYPSHCFGFASPALGGKVRKMSAIIQLQDAKTNWYTVRVREALTEDGSPQPGPLDIEAHSTQPDWAVSADLERVVSRLLARPIIHNDDLAIGTWDRAAGLQSLLVLSSDEALCGAIASAGGIEAVVRGMVQHLEAVGVQENGLAALLNLAADAALCGAIATAGGIEAVVRGMVHHPEAVGVQENGLAALLNLACNDEALRGAIATAGGIEAVVRGMAQHPEAVRVQHCGCATLRSLAADAALCGAIASAGGIEAVVRGMVHHPEAVGVQENGCAVLSRLAYELGLCGAIAIAGGIEAVVRGMGHHPECAAVQQDGCATLLGLALDAALRGAIGSAGGIEVVVRGMGHHPEAVGVQQDGCAVLLHLALDAALRGAIGSAGGIEAVVRARDAFHANDGVRSAADGALRLLQ
jgi:predicted RNA-binding protein YlqC (UPF0109 family)